MFQCRMLDFVLLSMLHWNAGLSNQQRAPVRELRSLASHEAGMCIDRTSR